MVSLRPLVRCTLYEPFVPAAAAVALLSCPEQESKQRSQPKGVRELPLATPFPLGIPQGRQVVTANMDSSVQWLLATNWRVGFTHRETGRFLRASDARPYERVGGVCGRADVPQSVPTSQTRRRTHRLPKSLLTLILPFHFHTFPCRHPVYVKLSSLRFSIRVTKNRLSLH